ncbi:hypothetical protein V8C42DRAFT_320258 [Trichoderma barbatum]
MNRFEAPNPGFQKTLNRRWTNAVDKKFGGYCFLSNKDRFWGDYWERFNTMQIPLFGEEEYVNTAIEVLNNSKNPEDFEKNFERVNKRRREVLMLLLGSALWKIHKRKDFPSQAARCAAIRACETGCFQYFLQLLKGDIWGWEADIAEDADTANTLSEEIPQGTVIDETQCRVEIPEEYRISDEKQKYFDECLAAGTIPEEWETQMDTEWDEEYKTPRQRQEELEESAKATFYIGTTWEYPAPAPNGTGTLNGDDDSLPSTMSPPPSPGIPKEEFKGRQMQGLLQNSLPKDTGSRPAKKRVRFADEEDDDDREPKRQKLDDWEPLSTPDTPSTEQPVINETPSPIQTSNKKGKRPRDDDEGDDDDNVEDIRKRQKLDSPTTLPTPDTPSAEQAAIPTALDPPPPTQAADQSTSGKRSRSDDEDDGDDDATNNPKRQRLESPESLADLDALLSQQIANEINDARRRAKKSTPRTRQPTVPSSPNRRSRRTSGQAALWELDGSGRPQSIR